MSSPAILGGPPVFPHGVPFARPFVPPLERVSARLAPSYERGILTNGPLVAELEERAADFLGVDHVVAVSSCTNGLILTLRALEPSGPVLLPSFTFSASAHAVAWNGLEPRFVECDPASFQIDVDDAARRLDGIGAVMATHVFGAPSPAPQVEAVGESAHAPVVFDAAHAFGAQRAGRRVGAGGVAEIFSLSPTKIVIAGEGGLVATGRSDVAESVRLGRDYGNPGDYNTRFVGLNARMSELHAAVALESFDDVDEHLHRRRALARRYREALASVPGITVQLVDPGDEPTFKDLTIAVDEAAYGMSRDVLVDALGAEGVDTRCYFDPPVHRQRAYSSTGPPVLPVTDHVSSRVVSLPMYADLELDVVDRIVDTIDSLHGAAAEVRDASAR